MNIEKDVCYALTAYLKERGVNTAEAKARSNTTAGAAVVQAAYDRSPLKGGRRDFEAWQSAFNELKKWSKTLT